MMVTRAAKNRIRFAGSRIERQPAVFRRIEMESAGNF